MVDVEQHALRAFEQDALARLYRLVEVAPDGTTERKDEVGNLRQVAAQPFPVDRRLVVTPDGVREIELA